MNPIGRSAGPGGGHHPPRFLARFDGDGAPTVGKGADTDVSVSIAASIPSTVIRSGALYTYSVKLLTGAGDASVATTLTVSVP